MRTSTCVAWVAALIPFVCADANAGEDELPPVFAKKSFDEAKAATKDGDKILIVKATAVWCMPCKRMDKTTWRDEKVVKWVKDNGLAIQIDVDKEKETAASLKIRAMPTMVAFKRGAEFDRIVGYQEVEPLLEWLEAVKKGERSSDKVLRQLEELKTGKSKLSGQERMNVARKLVEMDRPDDAADQYVGLWESTKGEPGMGGVRLSFMTSDMQRLAAENESARAKFTKLRDELAKGFTGDEKRERAALRDWIALNEVIADSKATLAWFDRVKDKPEATSVLESVGYALERLLEEHERWADLVRIYKDPLAKLREEHDQSERMAKMDLPGVDAEQKKEMQAYQKQSFQRKAGVLYAGLLAAKRDDDAAKLAAEAFKLDDSAGLRVALVGAAMQAEQPRALHKEWLAKAGDEPGIAALREQLDGKLNKK